ncbi:MAG: hypothetical protein NTY75_00890 [Candidatus Shapirobacteria bacterium]|nr:hypothetical protein [Candidatus Shapirobacteria bacterium]
MINFVIFGASGDLAKNYLFPALINLKKSGHKFNYFGYGRSPLISSASNLNLHYIQGGYDLPGLSQLKPLLTSDTIFYFALPTELNLIKTIVSALRSFNLISSSTRLVIEKPFGSDYTSAKALMDYFESNNLTDSVFLVDHFLTKNLVKNIISLRFANPIFSYLWHKQFIKEINLTAVETKGIDARGSYYDQTGAIRDMVQNHLLQLLTLVTMNAPASFNHADFVTQKLAVLQAIKIVPSSVKLGQYQSYTQELGVDPKSLTETFAKLKLKINLPEWRGIPINIITAKKLDQNITEINIVFNPLDKSIWGDDRRLLVPNQLTITLKPKNDIVLTINSSFNPHKVLPQPLTLSLGSLDISSSAYENVILDVLDNVKLNTPSFAEILLQWQIVDQILNLPRLRQHLFYY